MAFFDRPSSARPSFSYRAVAAAAHRTVTEVFASLAVVLATTSFESGRTAVVAALFPAFTADTRTSDTDRHSTDSEKRGFFKFDRFYRDIGNAEVTNLVCHD